MSGSKIKNYRWVVCVFLFLATTINYIDRQIFGLLKPELEKVFRWTEMDYSRIVMAFTACYALGQLVYGRIIDKIGTKLGYTISITLWSIAAMLHTVVKSTLGFALVRGFLGLGESGNYPAGVKRKDASGDFVEDNVPEDMSLVIRTDKGLVLLSGCGHAGIINTVTHVRNDLQQESLLAAIGGFHLLQNTDEQIKWTAEQLKASGIRYFMGAHCTGIEPVYQIREWASLKRGECIVGSVGDTFDPDKGFTSGPLTR